MVKIINNLLDKNDLPQKSKLKLLPNEEKRIYCLENCCLKSEKNIFHTIDVK